MFMKRKLSLLLLVALLASATACGESNTDVTGGTTDTTDVTDTESTADTEETEVPVEAEYVWADLNCNGDTFTLLNSTDTYGFTWALDSEGTTGENLNDAIYRRNRDLEDRYAFHLEVIDETFNDSTVKLRQSVRSDDDTYNAAFIWVNNLSALMKDGCFLNLYDVPTIQLNEAWWDQNTIESSKISNEDKLYFAFCNTSLVKFEGTQAVFMNIDKLDNLGVEAPYNLVTEGKWTIDEFCQLAELGANLNGDGKFTYKPDGNAEYGISGNEGTVYGLIYACANKFIEKDETGTPYFALNTERFYNTAEKIFNLTQTAGTFVFLNNGGEYHYEISFQNDRSLLMTAEIKAANKYREVDFTFGILPMPKYDEAQENYISVGGFGHAAVIPSVCSDPERSGAILDALAYMTEESVMPEFYSKTISQQRLRDEKSIEMLKIISQTAYLDPGELYAWSHDLREELIKMCISKNSNAFASTVASYEDVVKANISATLQEFAE